MSTSGYRRPRLFSIGSRSKTPDPSAAAAAAPPPTRSKTPAPPTSGSSSHRRAASNADSGYMTDAGSRRKDSRRGPPTAVPPVPAIPAFSRGSSGQGQPFPSGSTRQSRRDTTRNYLPRIIPPPPANSPKSLPTPEFLSDSEDDAPTRPDRGYQGRYRRTKIDFRNEKVINYIKERNAHQGVVSRYPLEVRHEARQLEKYLYGLLYSRLRSNGINRAYNLKPSFYSGFDQYAPRSALDIGCGHGYWLRDARQAWPGTKFVGFDIHNLMTAGFGAEGIPFTATKEVQNPIKFVQGDLLHEVMGADGRKRIVLPPELAAEGQFDYIRLANMSWCVQWKQWGQLLWNLKCLLRPGGILEVVDDGWFPPSFEVEAPLEPQTQRSYDQMLGDVLEMRGIRPSTVAQKEWALMIMETMKGMGVKLVGIDWKKVTTGGAFQDFKMSLRWLRTLMIADEAIESTFTSHFYQYNEEIATNQKLGRRDQRDKINILDFVESVQDQVNLLSVSQSDTYIYNGSTFAILVFQAPV